MRRILCWGPYESLLTPSIESTTIVGDIPDRFLPKPLKTGQNRVTRTRVEGLLTCASQWVGLLYVTWFHVMGVLSHRMRQCCPPLSLMSMTQASIRRVPDPGYVHPLT